MESIFFVIAFTSTFFIRIGKKIRSIYHSFIGFLFSHSKSKHIEDAQELTDEQYIRQFSKFFPKENEVSDNSFDKTVSLGKVFDRDRFYVKWSDAWM